VGKLPPLQMVYGLLPWTTSKVLDAKLTSESWQLSRQKNCRTDESPESISSRYFSYCKFLVDFGVRGMTESYLSPQNQRIFYRRLFFKFNT
jgi:hypothetical protein